MAISEEELAAQRNITVEQVRLLRRSRGATNATLAKLPDGALKRALRRLNYPDMPLARQAFRLAQAKDDEGRLPRNALGRALTQLKTLRKKVARPRVAGVPTARSVAPAALIAQPVGAGIAPDGWVWLGPGNVGGRTRSLVVHPRQPELMWAGSVGGGVWHTRDGGARWEPVDDTMANLAVSCMAMDPRKPTTIYAGTGEGFFNVDAIRGAGLFRTVDGITWKQLPATVNDEFLWVNELAVSPTGTVLLAATRNGLFRSADRDRAKWAKVLDGAVADVKFHPKSSKLAVAGGLRNGAAYYTTNGGRSWKPAAHPGDWSGRVELTYAAANPSIVYASVQMTHGELWRSSDGGKTYARRGNMGPEGHEAGYLGDQGWYGNSIWAGDPTDPDLVIVGGIDLWRSTDGGDTLVEISTWWDGASAHADHHAIRSHPGYDGHGNRTVFFCNDGGIHKAADVRTVGNEPEPPHVSGWSELVNNYGVTQFYGGASNPASGKIVGGAQDNGTICFDPARGTEGWRQIFGGDGGFCAADPTNPQVFYGEYVYLNIHRNTDGGASDDVNGDRYISGQFWNAAAQDWAWKPAPYRIADAMNFDALFIAPFVLDPNKPSRLLAGGLSLWRTDDANAPNTPTSGPRWQTIKPSVGAHISAIAIAKGDSNTVWVGHEDGRVFKSSNSAAATPTWRRVDRTGSSPLRASRYCTRIAVLPQDRNVVFVTFGGYVAENVWRTRDGGATWTDVAGSLPAVPVRAIAFHPRRAPFVYVGTEVGLFASEDGGTTWSPTNEGPTNCSVEDLFWMGDVLVCATHGRGMFKFDLSHA